MSAQTLTAESLSSRADDAPRPRTGRLLELNAETLRRNFNRRGFLLGHRLAGHPLFELPRLLELARRLPTEDVRYNSGRVSVETGLYRGAHNGLSIEETIRQIENCHSWMVLKFVERDPAYRELMDACLDEVQALTEELDPGMCRRESFIFITSPHAITPYHVDPEYNFLLQIRGSKEVHQWESADRTVITEADIEDYLARHRTRIEFRDEYEARATVFNLQPGVGLHFPVAAPHWVRNGNEVSVSFSITFRTPASERRVRVSQVNSALRRAGMNPAPYGRSPMRDLLKSQAWRAWRTIKRSD